MQDIKGFVNDFCRDQHGSRFIQQKLAEASSQQVMGVFEEVRPHVIALMQDVFGNYVIQKCFEHGSQVSNSLYTSKLLRQLASSAFPVYVSHSETSVLTFAV